MESQEQQAESTVDSASSNDAAVESKVSGFAPSSVQQYLHDIGAVSLLTREREIEIAMRIEKGQEDILQAIFIHPEPDSQALEELSCAEVRKALAILTPRQETVVRMRFGIGLKRDYTLEELGEKFAVTRERIRQIEQNSLQFLCNPKRRKPLTATVTEPALEPILD